MNYNVSSILNGTNQIRSSECGIYYQWKIVFMRNLRKFFQVNQIGIRISQGFYKNCFCIFLNRCFKRSFHFRIYKSSRYSVCQRECMRQKIVGSSINGFGSYNIFSCFCQSLECISNCRCSGCDCQRCHTAFQRSDSLFKNILCRIGQSSVNIPCIFQSESICCML